MYLDKNFRKLKIVGKTSDGKNVVAGIFPVVNSEGLALDIILEICKEKNFVIDWIDFIQDSIQTGWNINNTISKIKAALEMIYDEKLTKEWFDDIKIIFPSIKG